MKKVLSALLGLLLLTSPAFAAYTKTKVVTLKDSSGTAISDYSMTTGSAVQTEDFYVRDNIGFATLLVTEDQSGGAGDVDIYVEYSADRTNWYRAYTSDMAGTISQEGNIVTALQNVTRWIVFTPRLSVHMRIVFDPDANSEVTAVLLYQEDR